MTPPTLPGVRNTSPCGEYFSDRNPVWCSIVLLFALCTLVHCAIRAGRRYRLFLREMSFFAQKKQKILTLTSPSRKTDSPIASRTKNWLDIPKFSFGAGGEPSRQAVIRHPPFAFSDPRVCVMQVERCSNFWQTPSVRQVVRLVVRLLRPRRRAGQHL